MDCSSLHCCNCQDRSYVIPISLTSWQQHLLPLALLSIVQSIAWRSAHSQGRSLTCSDHCPSTRSEPARTEHHSQGGISNWSSVSPMKPPLCRQLAPGSWHRTAKSMARHARVPEPDFWTFCAGKACALLPLMRHWQKSVQRKHKGGMEAEIPELGRSHSERACCHSAQARPAPCCHPCPQQ